MMTYFAVLLKQDVSIIVQILPNVYLTVFFPLAFILIKHLTITIRLILLGLFYLLLKFFPPTFTFFLCVLIFLSMIILVREYFLGVRSGKIAVHFNTFDLLTALTLSSLAVIYPPGFKLAAAAFLFLTIVSLFLKKDRWFMILSIIKIIILAVLINPVAVGLVFTILTLLTVFFFGFGLTLFFIPAKLKAYAFWLTPWFSIFFLVFFLVLSNLLGFSVKQSSPVDRK